MIKLEGLTCSRLNGSSSYMDPKSVPMSRKVAEGSGTGTASAAAALREAADG